MHKPAILALEDGSTLAGIAIATEGTAVGEVVFNTAMTGYQEILTDTSYAQQIVTFTYPYIGNVGVNSADYESAKAWVAGMVIRNLSPITSSWRAEQSLAEFLQQQKIVAIAQLDTRRLTQLLRDKGVMRGCITTELSAEQAILRAQQVPSLAGCDLAKVVTTSDSYEWQQPSWPATLAPAINYHVVVMDFGVKRSILRLLVDRGCRVTVVPATTTAAAIAALSPDGVVLSNGPGDPEPCTYAIATIRELLAKKIPLFGICLGHQLLALALGGRTEKMKFGHHGANHPVRDVQHHHIIISSQNHGFTVSPDELPANVMVTHMSLFDGSVQGLACTNAPAFSFQGHPEAGPGPLDLTNLFDNFIQLIEKQRATHA